ncbi:hypothetical protein UY3_00296 [Chelonia mydas]|uniref:Uncharacterized protein n=1 Tax=Chelonia mydas TaxID=8469 RepID=M7CMJ8_CHEMY|nr:hypothetical protein UY3_00296 [Chelonia mydas]
MKAHATEDPERVKAPAEPERMKAHAAEELERMKAPTELECMKAHAAEELECVKAPTAEDPERRRNSLVVMTANEKVRQGRYKSTPKGKELKRLDLMVRKADSNSPLQMHIANEQALNMTL